MATDTQEHPCIEEQYEVASNTSDLSVSTHQRGAVDIIVAMAWSENRLGGALLRLHSQWESSEKPAKRIPRAVKQFLALGLKPEKAEESHQHEKALFERWHMHEWERLLDELKELPTVRTQVQLQAMKWQMGVSQDPIYRAELAEKRDNDHAMLERLRADVEAVKGNEAAETVARATLNHYTVRVEAEERAETEAQMRRCADKAAAVVRYWLDQTCQGCDGRKFQILPGTPSLSTKVCPACRGSGIAEPPHGQQGRRLLNWMDQCVHRGRQQIRNRLHGAKQ